MSTSPLAWVPDLIAEYIRYFSKYKSCPYSYLRQTQPYTHTTVYPIIAKYIHPITRPVSDRVPEYTRVLNWDKRTKCWQGFNYSLYCNLSIYSYLISVLTQVLPASTRLRGPALASTRVKYPRGMIHTRVDLC